MWPTRIGNEELKENKNITDKRKMNMENKLKILQIMKDYEKKEKDIKIIIPL